MYIHQYPLYVYTVYPLYRHNAKDRNLRVGRDISLDVNPWKPCSKTVMFKMACDEITL